MFIKLVYNAYSWHQNALLKFHNDSKNYFFFVKICNVPILMMSNQLDVVPKIVDYTIY